MDKQLARYESINKQTPVFLSWEMAVKEQGKNAFH
jgi:hypothetical protein